MLLKEYSAHKVRVSITPDLVCVCIALRTYCGTLCASVLTVFFLRGVFFVIGFCTYVRVPFGDQLAPLGFFVRIVK